MKQYGYITALLFLMVSCSMEKKITEELGTINITTGAYSVTATATGSVEESYMVVGWVRKIGLQEYQDASVACIPLQQVEILKSQYGDFMKCDSPGAAKGKESVVLLDIILAGPQGKEHLAEARTAEKQGKYPLIKVSGRSLQVVKADFHGINMEVDRSRITVLADSVSLEEENYSF